LLDTDLKIIVLDYQNNFVGTLKIMSNAAKNVVILSARLSVLHYFDSSTNYFFYLYPTKILAKPFFPCLSLFRVNYIPFYKFYILFDDQVTLNVSEY